MASPQKKTATENTSELFVSLHKILLITLDADRFKENLELIDRPRSSRRAAPHMNAMQRRPENMPPRSNQLPPTSHRPSVSEEDRRRQQRAPRPNGGLDIFADPSDKPRLRERRPRRNSESSVRDRNAKPNETEEEKQRRERRAAREKRHGKPQSTQRRLDLIDKLDVTSIYGTGCEILFLISLSITDRCSISPRRPFRRLQPPSQSEEFEASANSGLPYQFSQYDAGRRWP